MSRPNIIVFLSDQQRHDTCGCYGQTLPVTPELDRMAAEGVKFEHCFSAQPVCGPMRAAFQTGLYPTATGCHVNHRALPLDADTIAKRMRAAGYRCGYIGKWHLASEGERGGPTDFREKPVPPERRGGYDDFWLASDVLEFTSHGYDGHMFDGEGNKREFPDGRYRADAQTDWVLEYLDQQNSEQPFFLFLSYIEPHHQNDHHCYEGPHGSKERWKDFDTPGDLEGTEGDWRESYPDYLGCCNSLDENLGRIRRHLSQRGLADNTIIIYTSDHGCHFRTRNKEYKRSCHEASLHVPLVACGPGFTGGIVSEELVSLIDLPPTILDCAAVEAPPMHGRSFKLLASGNASDWPTSVFAQISESQCGRCIRTARWKYGVDGVDVKGHDAHAERYVGQYLYDLEADPHERDNRIDDPALADVREKLRAELRAHMQRVGEPPAVIA